MRLMPYGFGVRLVTLWESLQASFWFLPSLMVIVAMALGFVMPWLDRALDQTWAGKTSWLYRGGTEGARTVLQAIATSMLGAAGVVFSIVIVVLTLAANQFGPRLLRNFMRDKGNQIVLGTFVATFVYCLEVLRTLSQAEPPQNEGFVPHIAITLAAILAIVSLGFFIYFIHHMAELIQAPNVVAAVNQDLHLAIDDFFPEQLGRDIPSESELAEAMKRDLAEKTQGEPAPVRSPRSGYLQHIDTEYMMTLACHHDLLIKVVKSPGDFIYEQDPVIQVWPAGRVDEKLVREFQHLFNVNIIRTLSQDITFAINQLVEVGVRALSPGVNDPFTAMQCLDWLGEALARLASRNLPSACRSDDGGQLRIIATPTSFESMANAAFTMIRHASIGSPSVMLRMLETIEHVLLHTDNPKYRAVLREHAELVHGQAKSVIGNHFDLQLLEMSFQSIRDNDGKDGQA